jgi:GxxExxY protein
MNEDALSRIIIGAAIETHRELGGPGLVEDIYEEALCRELQLQGLHVARQISVPVFYKGEPIKKPLLLDVLVNELVIIEAKATERHNPLYCAQLLTYLRLSNKRLGLLINFGQTLVKDGIYRVVNKI